jgi:hypothetical protein
VRAALLDKGRDCITRGRSLAAIRWAAGGSMTRTHVVVLAGLLTAWPAFAADEFDSALKEARANEVTAAGRAYEGPLYETLGPALQRAMQQCFPASEPAAGTKFTIVVAILETGDLARSMVQPESAATACVVHTIDTVRVASPPRPNWWVVIGIKIMP